MVAKYTTQLSGEVNYIYRVTANVLLMHARNL